MYMRLVARADRFASHSEPAAALERSRVRRDSLKSQSQYAARLSPDSYSAYAFGKSCAVSLHFSR